MFPLVGTGILVLGVVYWAMWTKVWPRFGGYTVVAGRRVDEHGEEVVIYTKIWKKWRNEPGRAEEVRGRLLGDRNKHGQAYGSINP